MSKDILGIISSLNILYPDVNLVNISSDMNESSIKTSISTLNTDIDNTIVIFYGPNECNDRFEELSNRLFINFKKINIIFLDNKIVLGTTYHTPTNLNSLNKLKVNSYPINQLTVVIQNLLILLLKTSSISKSLYSIEKNCIVLTVSKLYI